MAAVTVLLVLIAWIRHRPSLSVTILNPKFRLLNAKLSHGPTHELAKASWPVTQLSKLLRSAGVNAVVPIQLPAMPADSYAFAVRYLWDFSPNETGQMLAQVVDVSGTVTRPRCWAGYSSERTKDGWAQGKIWVLDSPPTNAVTIRLSPGIGQPPLAEIRIRGN